VFGRRNRRTAGWRRRARDSILLCRRRRLVIGGRWVSGVRHERTGCCFQTYKVFDVSSKWSQRFWLGPCDEVDVGRLHWAFIQYCHHNSQAVNPFWLCTTVVADFIFLNSKIRALNDNCFLEDLCMQICWSEI
jgi:hypothetical protein